MTMESLTGLTREITKTLPGGLHARGVAPVTPNGQLADSSGTREYNFAQGTNTAFTGTSSAEVAIGTLSLSREIMMIASQRCHIRFGATGLSAAAVGAGVLPLAADERFHMKVPAGVTHFRVIRDSADGVLNVMPVA